MNLNQDMMSISMYYTRLKTIWEELTNYRPTCTCNNCTCGGVKKLQEHYHMEYIMSFLMGLKDSYSQVRGNILLMDPLPELNRVFHLVTQEENQHGTPDPTAPSMAFAVNSDKSISQRYNSAAPRSSNQRRTRPFCTHCNSLGHTIEKCYKLHGYPPGFTTTKPPTSTILPPRVPKEAAVNQAQTDEDLSKSSTTNSTILPQLTSTQYQQLLNLLASQNSGMHSSAISSSHGIEGQPQQEDDWHG
ncbi:uncharacterized protein LOC133780207 [Humulus lupulus]|uniref:uncharacterized protein LOC133780207 n=1 Tax=Humulus lupulus TaxID=3486 RepID=UPI002B416183|nr:uncharacterized protein LOC133780207 [Humulus lupulus]